ncbi:hypothetical protein BH23BAC3_BH23BAC3_24890 [soil metagenome]
MHREIYHFLLHLRLHYQFLILSGGYLLGGFIAGQMDSYQYWTQFLNVHILLFGGATAYNSWWDKDEGPIGGLKNPPKMKKWMHIASLLMMYAGLIWAMTVNWIYAGIYLVSFILFWLYSTPHARWKGRPILSLWAIGISTGFNSVLLGTIAAGGAISPLVLLSATGATCILLSLYPVSQIFQIEEDAARNDYTFTRMYGVDAVKRFFAGAYSIGSILLCISISWVNIYAAAILFVGITISGIFVATLIFRLSGDKNEYEIVMKTKFLASLSFVCFLLAGNVILYGWIN